MRILLILLMACATGFSQKEDAPDNDWNKVMALGKGTDVRITADGVKGVLEGRVDSVNDEAIVIVLPNEQRSIVRETVQRLDFRNSDKTKRLRKEDRVSSDDTSANPIPPGQRLPGQTAVPRNMSATSTVMLPSKAPWEPLYARSKGKVNKSR